MTAAEPIDHSHYAQAAELLGLDGARFAWRAYAACRGSDLDFVPPKGASARHNAAQLAVCESCPVKDPCLNHALRHGETGIWGGTTEKGRRGMRPKPATVAEKLLAFLAEQGPWTHGTEALAKQFGCSQSSISRSIRSLEAAGVVVVDPPAPRKGGAPICRIALNDRSNP